MEKWTLEQERAISALNGSVLVSASAGSGKTSVMIERVLRIVLSRKAEVKDLLVVTFAKAAASEMKRKLYLRLRECAAAEDGDRRYAARQLGQLDTASISTLHSFCAELARAYFYEAGLDAGFTVLGEQDAEVLKGQGLDAVMQSFAESGDAGFLELTEILTRRRRDTAFRELVLNAWEFLQADSRPGEFLERGMDAACREPDLACAAANRVLVPAALGISRRLDAAAERLEGLGLAKHAQNLRAYRGVLEGVSGENSLAENTAALVQPPQAVPRRPADCGSAEEAAILEYEAAKKQAREFIAGFAEDFGGEAIAFAERQKTELTARAAALCRVLARFGEEYARLKQDRNAVDFSDLEHRALRVLENPALEQAVREKYRYVFVDEYQDVNAVQEAILQKVSRNNLFMVGDVKQSIYGFRGSNPGIFVEKYAAYRAGNGGQAIDLNRNFRSRAGVLAFVNAVFEKVMTPAWGGVDYAADSVLTPGLELPDDGEAVQVELVEWRGERAGRLSGVGPYRMGEEGGESVRPEAELILRHISALVGSPLYSPSENAFRPCRYSDIVVLCRSFNRYAAEIVKYLSENGVPVVGGGEEGAGAEVKLLLNFLSCADNPRNDIPLAAVMRSVFGGFTDDELALLRERAPDCKFFHECVFQARGDGTPLGVKTEDFLRRMEDYRLRFSWGGIAEVLSRAVSESGYDLFLLAKPNGRSRYLKVANYLNQLAASELGLSLSAYLAQMVEGSRLRLGDTAVAEGDCVRFMTVHKSKGLEFPVVILAGTGQPFNFRDLGAAVQLDRGLGVVTDSYDLVGRTKRPTLHQAAVRLRRRREQLEEELRLLYVALTRAQQRLIVTGRGRPEAFSPDTGMATLLSCRCFLDYLSKELVCRGRQSRYGLRWYAPEELSPSAERGGKAAGLPTPDPARVEAYGRALRFTYPYAGETRARAKYTVTEIGEGGFAADDAPQDAGVLFSEAAAEKGVSYHAVLEHADLYDTSLRAISATVDMLVSKGVVPRRELVDVGLVKDCLDSALMDEARAGKAYREKPFLLYVSPRKLGGEGDGKVLVQGKIDLLILSGGAATVVDFKSAYLSTAEEAAKYADQLRLYAFAVESVLKIPVARRVVYSLTARRYFCV